LPLPLPILTRPTAPRQEQSKGHLFRFILRLLLHSCIISLTRFPCSASYSACCLSLHIHRSTSSLFLAGYLRARALFRTLGARAPTTAGWGNRGREREGGVMCCCEQP